MKAEEIVLPDHMDIPIESIAPIITRLSILQTALASRLVQVPVNSSPQCSSACLAYLGSLFILIDPFRQSPFAIFQCLIDG